VEVQESGKKLDGFGVYLEPELGVERAKEGRI